MRIKEQETRLTLHKHDDDYDDDDDELSRLTQFHYSVARTIKRFSYRLQKQTFASETELQASKRKKYFE